MNQLTKMFEGNQLRIVEQNNEPWFVSKDVCSILEIKNSRDAVSRLDDDEKASVGLTDGSQKRNVSIVNEFGLYNLVLGSRKPEAKEFKRWITHEVIPTIRKTGGYVQQDRAIDFVNSWLPQLDDNSKHAVASTLEQNKHLVNENKNLVTTIETQKPKVVFADAYEVSEDLITVKEMANLLKQKGLNTGEVRFYTWLRDNGYVCKKVGGMYNLPTQRSLDLGILEIKKGVRTGTGGAIRQTRTTKVTGKGQIYFVNKLLPELEVI